MHFSSFQLRTSWIHLFLPLFCFQIRCVYVCECVFFYCVLKLLPTHTERHLHTCKHLETCMRAVLWCVRCTWRAIDSFVHICVTRVQRKIAMAYAAAAAAFSALCVIRYAAQGDALAIFIVTCYPLHCIHFICGVASVGYGRSIF